MGGRGQYGRQLQEGEHQMEILERFQQEIIPRWKGPTRAHHPAVLVLGPSPSAPPPLPKHNVCGTDPRHLTALINPSQMGQWSQKREETPVDAVLVL